MTKEPADYWAEENILKRLDEAERAQARANAAAEIERLAKLTKLQYEMEREAVAKRLGIGVTRLDELVKEERRKQRTKKKAPPQFNLDELKGSAKAIIDNPDILNLFAAEFSKVIAGEETNGKLLYLVATSPLFDNPMNAAIKGTSAGGKSEIRKRVLEFFPPESVVSFTSLSDKALFYFDGDFDHKILSMAEASATDEQDFQDYLLRELMSEGRLRYPTVQKVGGELVTITIEKNGPVAFLVTTTRNALHPENETRLLSLEIDDSERQTKKVLDKVARVAGLRDIAPINYKPWQDFQRWLAAGECRVVVPFAAAMVQLIPPVAVRLRRDVGQVITAIQAHALLHHGQRNRDEAGRIIADIDHDYYAVGKLMNAIVAEGSGVAVNPAITETIEAVTKATLGMTEAEGANAKAIAKLLKLDRSAAWRRLSAACDDGYVVNLEQRQRMPGKYRPSGQKVEPVAILPAKPDLAKRFENLSSQTPPKSVRSCNRDEIAEVSLRDNECKDECTRVHECNSVQTGLALDNRLSGKGKSPPVARVQRFSGGIEKETSPQPDNAVDWFGAGDFNDTNLGDDDPSYLTINTGKSDLEAAYDELRSRGEWPPRGITTAGSSQAA